MKIQKKSIASLLNDPANVRKHGERNLEAIKGSLSRFGQQKPIVIDGDGVVVAGNGTLEAARQLGWKDIAAVRTALKGSDRAAYAIADNRTSELAEWDYEALSQFVDEARLELNLESVGWTAEELNDFSSATWQPNDTPADLDQFDNSGGAKSVKFTNDEWAVLSSALESYAATRSGGKATDAELILEIITGHA